MGTRRIASLEDRQLRGEPYPRPPDGRLMGRPHGARVRLSINGVETVDYVEPDDSIPRQGVIALQIHGKMVGTVRYRNIRITELP
jgi:hypothetical protein